MYDNTTMDWDRFTAATLEYKALFLAGKLQDGSAQELDGITNKKARDVLMLTVKEIVMRDPDAPDRYGTASAGSSKSRKLQVFSPQEVKASKALGAQEIGASLREACLCALDPPTAVETEKSWRRKAWKLRKVPTLCVSTSATNTRKVPKNAKVGGGGTEQSHGGQYDGGVVVYIYDTFSHGRDTWLEKNVRVARHMATLGLGPKVHDAFFCDKTQGTEQTGQMVVVQDLVEGAPLATWFKTAAPEQRSSALAQLRTILATCHRHEYTMGFGGVDSLVVVAGNDGKFTVRLSNCLDMRSRADAEKDDHRMAERMNDDIMVDAVACALIRDKVFK